MAFGNVGVELQLHSVLYNLGAGWDDGDETKVGCIGGPTGFMNEVNNEMLPGCGKLTGCKAVVENVGKEVTDDIELRIQILRQTRAEELLWTRGQSGESGKRQGSGRGAGTHPGKVRGLSPYPGLYL